MPKVRTVFACTQCGAQAPKWLGQCPECGTWGSLLEETPIRSMVAEPTKSLKAVPISEVDSLAVSRRGTGVAGFDRVLGGGLVPGSLTLLGGEPGIGKSTLLTEVAGKIPGTALYLSGEESPSQVKLRADRMGSGHEGFLLAGTTSLEECLGAIREYQPDLVIVDSIQTLSSEAIDSAAGSVSQVRGCAAALQAAIKGSQTALVLVGHVTKEGSIAGPKVLEHLVDTVIAFEGDGFGKLRALRCMKNRFGSVSEIAVFTMEANGLIEVENPSTALLAERQSDAAGSAVFAAIEGSRSILLEVQALVAPNYTNNPRRTVSGVEFNRALLVLGVMEKRCGLRLSGCDVFINVVGGLQIREPGVDLAMFLAVASSLKDVPVPADLVAFGEIGLTGEIRSIADSERRLAEAARMGFKRAAVSKNIKSSQSASGIKAGGLRDVRDALGLLGL
ncbi:MAG: DNA repair protein RadA [Fimbriimonadales bacterium]